MAARVNARVELFYEDVAHWMRELGRVPGGPLKGCLKYM